MTGRFGELPGRKVIDVMGSSLERKRSRPDRTLMLVAGLLLACLPARADEIVLRGGGSLQGKLIVDPKTPQVVQVLLLKGSKPLTFRKEQILEVIRQPGPLDDYLARRSRLASTSTAQAEFDLGLWCETNKLADLAKLHYHAALTRDENFEAAHKKLGHISRGGQWYSTDDVRQSQGLIKDHGQWITEQAKAKREETAQAAETQAGWLRRIHMLRQAVLSGSDDRRREAENELMHIEEHEAVAPLVKVLGKDTTPLRLLLVQTLGQIDAKESTRALVQVLLADPEDQVRTSVVERLRERDESIFSKLFVQALRSKNIRVVNRAAWALGQLGVVLAVPKLAGSLISTEERLILVPAEGEAAATPSNLPGPVLMGMNQSFAAYMTGPSMAPGAVGFGATSVPLLGNVPLAGGNYLGMGTPANRGPQPRYVTYAYENIEVRNALQKLTGQDFGYDAAAWRQWIKTSFNPNPTPVRQVHQP